MKTDVLMHLTALSNVNGKNSLREGSSVYVRIIKNNGNNSYLAAFSGGRFFLKSKIPLAEGSGFLAKLKLENGKIILQKVQSNPENKDSIQRVTAENQALFLEKMGLVPDNISFSLLQQMKMLGSRFSLTAFQKSRKIADKIKNKEKTAADVAFILEEKGISSDEKKVAEILGNDNTSGEISEKIALPLKTENPFKVFFENILNSSENLKNQPGILTLFNHIGFCFDSGDFSIHEKKGFGSWIKIPFEFSFEEKNGKGSFCGFLKNSSKNLEKAVVCFYLEKENYVFEFGLNGNKLLYLNAGCSDSLKTKILVEILNSSFEKTKIRKIDSFQDFSEFSADDIEINSVSLSV